VSNRGYVSPVVSRAYVPLLLLLAAFWGASFMFIKVADRVFAPWTLMFLRLALTSVIMCAVLAAQLGAARTRSELRALAVPGLVLGVINASIPFTLIAWGEKHVDSGIAAIANASMPIFIALLALRWQRSERVVGLRLLGIVVGIVGVGVLAGVHPRGGWWGVAGTLAVVLASVFYAVSSLYAQRLVERTTPEALVTASMLGGALALLPFAAAALPSHVPNWKEWGSVAALAVLGTAIGQLVYYKLLQTDGSSRASLVTYLIPGVALFYGVTLLGEPLTVEELVGLVLILAGVAVGSGVLRLPRQATVRASPAP
jgi:drug/metabolite transporter (DMT)-like permease